MSKPSGQRSSRCFLWSQLQTPGYQLALLVATKESKMNTIDKNTKPRPITHFLLTMLGGLFAVSALATAMPDTRPVASLVVGVAGLVLYFKGTKIMPDVPRSAYTAIILSALLSLPTMLEEKIPTNETVYKAAPITESDQNNAQQTSSNQDVWNAKGQEAIRRKLKDPGSAQFRNVRFSQTSGVPVTCGEVNSKNSYGGYSGFQRFVASGEGNLAFLETQVSDFSNVWKQMCSNN